MPAVRRSVGSRIRSASQWGRITFGRCRPIWMALPALMLAGQAWADLMIFPTRLVFENNQRAAQIELVNNGSETATYRISIVNRRMSEFGQFSAAETPAPGELFADHLLRYSPRQVVLAPGVGQTVRIALRKPADLPTGEYRSHLQFDRLPPPGGFSSIDAIPAQSDGLSVQLRTLVGVSIPLIVRHGETASQVSVSGLELLPGPSGEAPSLAAVLQRTGNRSVYGDLGATFTPQGGVPQEVGKAGGVAVYSPNALRRVVLVLQAPASMPLARGTLRLSFRERPEAGGKLLAEAAVELP